MELTKKEVEALIDWANESYREGGLTAWGVKFNRAMEVARNVKKRADRRRKKQ